MKPLFGKVGVFGVGLLGGSVALGIKERFLAEEVHAYDQDPMALEKVLFLGVADRVHTEVGPWVGELDLGILAAPVGALAELGKALAPWAHPESLWTDVGSVKAKVVAALEGLLPHYLGGHPMAGSERAGVENAHAGLLQNAVWVLTPTERTSPRAREGVRGLVEALGAYPWRCPGAPRRARGPGLPPPLPPRRGPKPHGGAKPPPGPPHVPGGGGLPRPHPGGLRLPQDEPGHGGGEQGGPEGGHRGAPGGPPGAGRPPGRARRVASGGGGGQAHPGQPPHRAPKPPPEMHDLVVQVPDRPGEIARIATALGEAGVNIKDIEVLTIREAAGALRLSFATREERERARRVLQEAGYRLP